MKKIMITIQEGFRVAPARTKIMGLVGSLTLILVPLMMNKQDFQEMFPQNLEIATITYSFVAYFIPIYGVLFLSGLLFWYHNLGSLSFKGLLKF